MVHSFSCCCCCCCCCSSSSSSFSSSSTVIHTIVEPKMFFIFIFLSACTIFKVLTFAGKISDFCGELMLVAAYLAIQFILNVYLLASMNGISCKDLVNSENHETKSCLQLAVDGGHVEVVINDLIAHKFTS